MPVDCDPPFSDATLNFAYVPNEARRAYQCINVDTKTGIRDKNLVHSPCHVRVENIHRTEDSITLDTTGFMFNHSPTKFTDFTNDEHSTSNLLHYQASS